MGTEIFDLLGELKELALDARRRAEDTGYGYFPGGDPNTFSPDHESCTPEEIQRWKDDCAKWNAGQREGLTQTACTAQMVGNRVHFKPAEGYGVGTYTMEDPQAADDAEKLESIASRLEGWLVSRTDADLGLED